MNKLVLSIFVLCLGLGIVLAQEMTLDPEKFVNTQIQADTLADGSQVHSLYKVESGTYYAFDGTLECDFDLVIAGPDNGWIFNDATPPVFYQTPSPDGDPRDMINLIQGGSVELRNIMLTGLHPNDVNISSFVRNYAGYKIVWENCVFTDYKDHCTRTTWPTEEISVTNCIFINGDRRGSSPFGGIPIRLDESCGQLTFENNSIVNSGRLLGNGGNFFTSKMAEIHNTILNQQVNGHELHWFEGLQANNIYYNWSWRGRIEYSGGYDRYFTTFETYAGVEEKLDSIALYQGRNLFYLDPVFPEYWQNTINPTMGGYDSVSACSLWNIDVDCTIVADNNFTIGKSYGDWDPLFTNDPSQIDSMLGWLYSNWVTKENYADWRVTPPVTWNEDGTPRLNWSPDWDLSYSSSTLQKGGTDGLPLGDLNWFPDAKATYLANRDTYIAALQDSMANAKDVYVPGNAASALITPDMVSVEDISRGPCEFRLYQNYPNPFNPKTIVRYTVGAQSLVSLQHIDLSVYNILGQKVTTLINKKQRAGSYQLEWNAHGLSSGVYYYRMQAGDFVQMKKMLLIK